MYCRMLVPLDGSKLAESVLPLAVRLMPAGGTLSLLHVLERKAPEAVHGDRHLRTMPEAEAYLNEVTSRLAAADFSVEQHVHEVPEGDVARSIVAHAEENGADLIALCTHGTGRVRQMLFGSIALQVVGRGSTPVLLVRPEAVEVVPAKPSKVLVPLDGTAGSEVALAPAAELARTLDASLHLMTVVPTQETVAGDRSAAATLLPSATRAALDMEQQETCAYLEQLAARWKAPDRPVTVEVRRGDVPMELSDEAAEPDVALAVVSTHGHSGLQAILAGSVTAGLLGRSRTPLLLVRRSKE